MELTLVDDKGVAASVVTASDSLFGRDYNEALVHQLVVAYQANARSGNRAQKDRSPSLLVKNDWLSSIAFLLTLQRLAWSLQNSKHSGLALS